MDRTQLQGDRPVTIPTVSRLLTLAEVRSEYGVPRSTIYRLLKTGDLEGVKRGSRTLIPRPSIEAWLSNLPRYVPQRP